MNLLTQNSKLKKTSKNLNLRVFNFGIPAYKSASGKLTCPMADECVEFCYAKKGAYVWSNVQPAFEKRYQLSKTLEFIDAMNSEIKKKRPEYVRVHDSGDYYSRSYLAKWITIANQNPSVKFYSYTNMVDMIKNTNLPDNYDIIFSDSGKQKHMINQNADRHTKIFKSKEDLLSKGYVDASDTDLYATKWFNKTNRVGLIFH
jgi:hypothetical protein|tara:strand:+ start:2454 stop:3059 length:606 start_codon:yes stop_codon:yes gene_type:complete